MKFWKKENGIPEWKENFRKHYYVKGVKFNYHEWITTLLTKLYYEKNTFLVFKKLHSNQVLFILINKCNGHIKDLNDWGIKTEVLAVKVIAGSAMPILEVDLHFHI